MILNPLLSSHVFFSGAHRIRFKTKDQSGNYFGPKRVHLLDRVGGHIIQEQWSDSGGNGAFNYIANREQGYTVAACNNRANAASLDYPAIADFVTPEPMP